MLKKLERAPHLLREINKYFSVCCPHPDEDIIPCDPTPPGLAMFLGFESEKVMIDNCKAKSKQHIRHISRAYMRIEDHWCQKLGDPVNKNGNGAFRMLQAKFRYAEKIINEHNVNEVIRFLPQKVPAGAAIPLMTKKKTASKNKTIQKLERDKPQYKVL